MTHLRRTAFVAVSCAMLSSACSTELPTREPELVFSLQPPTWFEDGWSRYEVSPDGATALFGARFGRRHFDIATADPRDILGDLNGVSDAFFSADGALWRRGERGLEVGWFSEEPGAAPRSDVPAEATLRFSPDGVRVAYFVGTAGSGPTLFVGPIATPVEHDLGRRVGRRVGGRVGGPGGGRVTGMGWAPDGRTVYATIFREDGVSALFRVSAEGGAPELVRDGLDGLARFNSIAVAPDGRSIYLALAGAGPPDAEARHDPEALRHTEIYRLDLPEGALTPVVTASGDDFAPQIVDGHLYWTHNDYDDRVAVLPIDGGEPRDILGDAQIPYWSADGSQIAVTVGGWAIADWALNMDAWVTDVDDVGDRRSPARPLVQGYHEDFTPAWSPDGRWLAYHSHRSEEPVSHYFAAGGTDDIYLRSTTNLMAEEIRLMDFGWEVGMADWDRTSTRLFFDSWERGGPAGVSQPWIATIDPETGRATSMDRLPLPDGFGGTVLASWSPVADELAVVERGGGNLHAMWLMAPDGSGARRLFEYDASTYGGVDWTPDGSTLVFGGLTAGRMQLFAYDLGGGGAPTQLTSDSYDVLQPQVSPDGRWIAASRLRHVKELWRMPIG